MKTRREIMRKFEEHNLVDYQLGDIEDLKYVFNIDVNNIQGYSTLDDSNKQLFNEFIVNFLNGLGIDSKLCVDPLSIYFVEEYESFVKDLEECETDSLYVVSYEYKLAALDKDMKPVKKLIENRLDKYKECEILSTSTKRYLRFTYFYKYGENLKKEWLHVMNENEWY